MDHTEVEETQTPHPAPPALRIRVLREVLARMEGSRDDGDSATEDVGASTVRTVLAEILADMQPTSAGSGEAATPATNGTSRQNPDGTWGPAEPLPLTDDFNVEVYGTGPYRWDAWVGMTKVATGTARTPLGLKFAIVRAKRRHAKTTA